MTLGSYKCGNCNSPLGTIKPHDCFFCGSDRVETMWEMQPPWESLGNWRKPSESGTAPAQPRESMSSAPIPPSMQDAMYQMLLSNVLMNNAINTLTNSLPGGPESEKAPPWYPENLPWPPKKPWE